MIMKKKRSKLSQRAKSLPKRYRQITCPKIEDVLFVFLIVFCIFLGTVFYLSGKQIEKEVYVSPVSQPVVINEEVQALVAGSPMEKMVPYLSQKDEQVASYLVAIAKKESNWGKFSPQKDGRECFNYWGYRGRENTTRSGYSCFKNPRQAVNVVGERIAKLLEQEIDTPREMVVWKCGRNCEAAGGQAAAEKWIQDVDYYYRKLYN